jgi:hypothetical protein
VVRVSENIFWFIGYWFDKWSLFPADKDTAKYIPFDLLLGDISMWIVIGIAIVILFVLLFFLRLNNFVLIARNLTYIHEILRNEHNERFPDEDTLLITCGIIDTRSYNFPPEDMKIALSRAKKGQSLFENYEYHPDKHNLMLTFKNNDLFLNLVVELEIMMLLRDSSFSHQNILSSVVSSIDKIEKAIAGARCSYANGKRRPLWRRAVSNFMTSGALEPIRDQIGIIRPSPEQQLDLLFRELVNRKHWKDIDPEIIINIFNNAKGDVDMIKRFIFISELYNTVGNNFVQLSNEPPKEFILSMFALTLYRLGSALDKSLSSDKTENEVSSLVNGATMAFMSSVLCEPYFLESYACMAYLYSDIDKDIALEWCAKYKEAEGNLLNTPDEELNIYQLERKKEILDPEEYHKTLREISKKSRCLHIDESEVDGVTSTREMIAELEEELMQRA